MARRRDTHQELAAQAAQAQASVLQALLRQQSPGPQRSSQPAGHQGPAGGSQSGGGPKQFKPRPAPVLLLDEETKAKLKEQNKCVQHHQGPSCHFGAKCRFVDSHKEKPMHEMAGR